METGQKRIGTFQLYIWQSTCATVAGKKYNKLGIGGRKEGEEDKRKREREREREGERLGQVCLNLQHKDAKVTSKEATRYANAKESEVIESGVEGTESEQFWSSRFVKSLYLLLSIQVRLHELWSGAVNRFRSGGSVRLEFSVSCFFSVFLISPYCHSFPKWREVTLLAYTCKSNT